MQKTILLLYQINFRDKKQLSAHDKIVQLVETMTDDVGQLHNLQKKYLDPIFDHEGLPKHPKLCRISPQAIIRSLPPDAIRRLSACSSIYVNKPKGDFKMLSVSDIFYNLNFQSRGFNNHIIVYGSSNEVVSIEGASEGLN
jgi:hypothetical protein